MLVNFNHQTIDRRENPTPYINFIPPEVIMHGESQMLAALEARPPAYVAWAPKDTREYGFEGLGIDYGTNIARWVWGHYRDVESGPRAAGGFRDDGR